MGPEGQRLFIALELPAAVRATLATLQRSLPGVTWTPLEQLHVTLRFLGAVPNSMIGTVMTALGQVKVAPFLLPIEGCGIFPPGAPPRVLWAGVGSGHPRLFQLRQRIDDALLGCGLGIDVRTFHPHVTLARCRETAGLAVAAWSQAQRDFAGPPFRVEAFDLKASELRPSGAIHSLQQRFPLAG